MPWCPECNKEYRKGTKTCTSCKSNLVDEAPLDTNFIPYIQTEDKAVVDRLSQFYDYSGLKSTINYDEANEIYILSVPKSMEKQAKKLYQAFSYVEKERSKDENSQEEPADDDISSLENASEDYDTDYQASDNDADADYLEADDKPAYKKSSVNKSSEDDEPKETAYIMKADRYKDYNATVSIFLFFGIAGSIIVILNAVGILSFFSGIFSNIVMGILFLSFIYVGLSTYKKAKQLRSEIQEENQMTERINSWLKDNLTEEFLASTHNSKISDELNYIKQFELIKKKLLEEFGDQNSAYLDRLIEEYYYNTFE